MNITVFMFSRFGGGWTWEENRNIAGTEGRKQG
jgi:hypothetical protein